MEIINKKCIVRCYGAGVFFGTIVSKVDTVAGVEVELKDCRRLWYWKGAASLSQMANEGVKNPSECKIAMPVKQMVVTQVIEILPCSEEAVKNLESVPVWRL